MLSSKHLHLQRIANAGKILPEAVVSCMTAVFLQATLLCSCPVSREVPYTKDTKTQSIANTKGHLLKKQAQPWGFKSKFLNAISFNYTIE